MEFTSSDINDPSLFSRRDVLQQALAASAFLMLADASTRAGEPKSLDVNFKLNYLLSSSMYGYTKLEELLPEVRKTGATAIDIWPKVHGDQREQLTAMGEDKFRELLEKHQVTLGCITQYKLGPFGLQEEMKLAQRFNCKTMVTGGSGPKGLAGSELKSAVAKFAEQMKPHLDVAAQTGVTIAIENHANNLFESIDSMLYLIELCEHKNLGIALAPYHLPQEPETIAKLIRDLGSRLSVFYAWQHGMGSMQKQPREQELQQLPGFGPLEFRPILKALKDIKYQGWTSIFMHPFPRGLAIHETTELSTQHINKSREYLATCLASLEGMSMQQKEVLIVVGDAAETLDTMYPYYRLIEAGFKPVVAAPEKKQYQMVMHEVKPGWTITKEWEGYTIQANIAFKDIIPENYAGIMFSGGRAPEYIRYDPDLVRVTKHFFDTNKPIACVCHGVEIPAYANCVKGRRMATVAKCRFDLEVCGGIFVDEPCVIDGNLVSGRTFHDNGQYIGPWIKLLEAANKTKAL